MSSDWMHRLADDIPSFVDAVEPANRLPAEHNVWSGDCGGFRQRWLLGAFGRRVWIGDVDRFKVLEDDWQLKHGIGWRTILRAEIVSLEGKS